MSGSSGFAERQKRHGFADGARALYEAIYQHVPPGDQVIVENWLAEVDEWETAAPIDRHDPPLAALKDVSKTSAA